MKTYKGINKKIANKECVVVTAEEIMELVKERGQKKVAKEVDVVTTGTFGAMCSSGIYLNFGHSEPPIKILKAWLNGVPAYCGLAAVDAYIGATELDKNLNLKYGGAHVIEDLIKGKSVHLRAIGFPTDCYPRKKIDTYISLKTVNQAVMFNPRNAYQNYGVATNSSNKTLYTYMGKLLPNFGNANYSSAGQLSPLLNDPYYKTIGIGTRIFIGGTQGYVVWEGTQFKSKVNRTNGGVPKQPAGSLGIIGNLKNMKPDYIKALSVPKYGVSIGLGIGVPIPILNEEILKYTLVRNRDIYTTVYDYSVPSRNRPILGEVNYEQLRNGFIKVNGKEIPTRSLSNYRKAQKIADALKKWIQKGQFLLQEPVQRFSLDESVKPMSARKNTEGN
ncbi:homocysteine biosynthesis protein [Candidatus Pacearchaeota archaeon]|nr:homocysteine biosynthesis protein [Candidatus Pacearchaeota archaeon]